MPRRIGGKEIVIFFRNCELQNIKAFFSLYNCTFLI